MLLIFFSFLLSISNSQEYSVHGSYSFSLSPGDYTFECWGAQGGQAFDNGDSSSVGGKGAYAYGNIKITTPTDFQAFVGGMGGSLPSGDSPGGFNGGGMSGNDTRDGDDGSGGGGGASDIRFSPFTSKERILVAGGGSGGAWNCRGAPGGAVTNFKAESNNNFTKGSLTETTGGDETGQGGKGEDSGATPGSGGGGGWRGGPGGGTATISSSWSYGAVGESGNSYRSTQYFYSGGLQDGTTVYGREGAGKIVITTNYVCSEGCSECTSSTQCSKCLEGYPFLYGKQCYTTCPTGTYSAATTCEECDSSCLTCDGSGSNNCLSCSADKKLYNKQCYSVCPDGTYSSTTTCLKCDSSCAACDGSGSNNCLSCPSTHKLYNKQCYSVCPTGTYSSTTTCEKCHTKCKECEGPNENQCTLCNNNDKYFENRCYDVCPSGTYPSSNYCITCTPNCLQCFNGTICGNCLENYYLYDDGRCLTKEQCKSKVRGNKHYGVKEQYPGFCVLIWTDDFSNISFKPRGVKVKFLIVFLNIAILFLPYQGYPGF